MALDDILEVRAVTKEGDANALLSNGSWRLLSVATEKLVEDKQIGSKHVDFLLGMYEDTSAVVGRTEYQQTTYVLGRYKKFI